MDSENTTDMIPNFGPRYAKVVPLGKGGMGTVWRAYDNERGHVVALKAIRKDHLANEEVRRRFKREAKVLTRLRHPNIVQLYDFVMSGPLPYFSMELVEGTNLKDLAATGELRLKTMTQIAIELNDGLTAIHEAGVIHRDIKPGNVVVTKDGHPKLMDFGLAKIIDDVDVTALTAEGAVLGTLLYMAPESLEGATANARTDIYQMGVLLYYFLAGRHPFASLPHLALFRQEPYDKLPSPSKINPAIPESLDQIVTQAMAPLADDRPVSASELASALRRILNDETIQDVMDTVTLPRPTAQGPLGKVKVPTTVRLQRAPVARPGSSKRVWFGLISSIGLVLILILTISRQNPDSINPVQRARTFREAVVAGDLPRVALFLKNGASANARLKDGRPVLCVAAEKNYYDIFCLLLDNNADPSEADNDGLRAIHYATMTGSIKLLKRFDTIDVAFDSKDHWGRTVMHRAAEVGSAPALSFFLSRGLDLEALDLLDRSPLFYAAEAGHLECVDILLDEGADEDLQELERGSRPIHFAARSGKLAVVERLLEAGASLRADRNGKTVIAYAAEGGKVAVISYLIKQGRSVSLANDEGVTPLHLASTKAAVDRLLAAGASLEAINNRGMTAVHYQAFLGRHKTVEHLLACGIGLLADKEGRKPSELAELGNNPTLATILRKLETSKSGGGL